MADTATVTWLLGVIAIATSLQTLMLVGAGVMMFRAYRKAIADVRELQREMLPLFDRAHRALDAIEDTTARLRAVDDNVRHAMTQTREATRRGFVRLKNDWWPVIATGRAALAAVRGFRDGRSPNGSQPRALRGSLPAMTDDETRFDYEGGTHARS
jgi:hypothetical protein